MSNLSCTECERWERLLCAVELERDQMTARCAELHEELASSLKQCGCGHPHCNMCNDYRDAKEVLERAPAASLSAIQADTLEEKIAVICEFSSAHNRAQLDREKLISLSNFMLEYCQALREGK